MYKGGATSPGTVNCDSWVRRGTCASYNTRDVGKRLVLSRSALGSRLWDVLVANHGHDAKLRNATEHMYSNIGAARVVAKVFRENFFAAVRSRKTRLDGYLRNGVPLAGYFHYLTDRGL